MSTMMTTTMMMMMMMIMMLLISNVATVTAKGLTSSKGDIRFLMPIIGGTDVKSYFNEDPIILVDNNDILDEINSNVNNNNNNNINAKNANENIELLSDSKHITYDLSFYSSSGGTITIGKRSDLILKSIHDHVSTVLRFMVEHPALDLHSFDNNGSVIRSYGHVGNKMVNAYYSSSGSGLGGFYYGDGDSILSGPLGVLDVVGHEMAHAITASHSGLIYKDEPGAISEASSDIFAVGLERWYDRSVVDETFGDGVGDEGHWTIAEDAWLASPALRYLNCPSADGFSVDHYDSLYKGSYDKGGIHINSGIINHFFYLLSVGGEHWNHSRRVLNNNNNNNRLGVKGVGLDVAFTIYTNAWLNLMEPNTDIHDARMYTLTSCQNLNMAETVCASVNDAWAQVGVVDMEEERIVPPSKEPSSSPSIQSIESSPLPPLTICYKIEFVTGTRSVSPSPGTFKISGYGNLPKDCHIHKNSNCTIDYCINVDNDDTNDNNDVNNKNDMDDNNNPPSLQIETSSKNGWEFAITIGGEYGKLLRYRTSTGGKHMMSGIGGNNPRTFLDADQYDTWQEYELKNGVVRTNQPTTMNPTNIPTNTPTKVPTKVPTMNPTKVPTNIPTKDPTNTPTKVPTNIPTNTPTKVPTVNPTKVPTKTMLPTIIPTDNSSERPTFIRSMSPTEEPTKQSSTTEIPINLRTTIDQQYYDDECYNITFVTGQRRGSASTGPFVVIGYGELPGKCHSHPGASCEIKICVTMNGMNDVRGGTNVTNTDGKNNVYNDSSSRGNNKTFERSTSELEKKVMRIESKTNDGWEVTVGGDVGVLSKYSTGGNGDGREHFEDPTWLSINQVRYS